MMDELTGFVVALECGGIMEDPDFYYKDRQVIYAHNAQEACEIYNDRNNCNYYYGKVIGVVDEYEHDFH